MPQFPSAAHSGAYWPVRSQSSLLVAGGAWSACGAGLPDRFNTKNTRRCVELFVTLGFATKSQRICDACEGLPAWFNARALSLVPSHNSDARKILLRSLFPEYADGTLTQRLECKLNRGGILEKG